MVGRSGAPELRYEEAKIIFELVTSGGSDWQEAQIQIRKRFRRQRNEKTIKAAIGATECFREDDHRTVRVLAETRAKAIAKNAGYGMEWTRVRKLWRYYRDGKDEQESELRKSPDGSVSIHIEDPVVDATEQPLTFTIHSSWEGLLIVDRLALEVVKRSPLREIEPYLERWVLIMFPIMRKVQLVAEGRVPIEEKKLKYHGPDVEEFKVTCMSPAGWSYRARVVARYYEVGKPGVYTARSEDVLLRFPREA